MRDLELLEKICRLPDDVLVGINEVALLTDLSPVTVQQRKLRGFPSPIPHIRKLRWRLGDVRTWIRTKSAFSTVREATSRKASGVGGGTEKT